MLQILPRGVHIHIYGLNQLKIMYFNIVGMYTFECVHVGVCAYRYGGIQRLQVSIRCLPDQSPPYILSMEFLEWLGSKPRNSPVSTFPVLELQTGIVSLDLKRGLGSAAFRLVWQTHY